jgi:hypothetical protein
MRNQRSFAGQVISPESDRIKYGGLGGLPIVVTGDVRTEHRALVSGDCGETKHEHESWVQESQCES